MTTAVTIANPIYDSVFKHLMENMEVAKGLISALLGLEVTELMPAPQEITHQQGFSIGTSEGTIRVFRLDFAATITLTDGTSKRVLIELQKAGMLNAIDRFRSYLGEHYAKPPPAQQSSLPIVAVYLCGFWINRELPTVVRVKRQYLDAYAENETVLRGKDGRPYQDDFIEKLTHDAVMVQIPSIPFDQNIAESPLKQALQAFNQKMASKDGHLLTLTLDPKDAAPAWVSELLRVLTSAAADEPTKQRMAIEDEILLDMERKELLLAAETQRREAAEQLAAEERFQKEAAEQRELEERLRKEAAEQRELEERLRKEAAEQRELEERLRKEAAEQREREERRLKEEERRLKEAALAELAELRRQVGIKAAKAPDEASG